MTTRLLYVAANPAGKAPLNLEAEISAIQQKVLADPKAGLDVKFLPDLDPIQLAEYLSQYKPDILHLAFHGDDEVLSIKKAGGGMEEFTAKMLGSLFADAAPRLIFVNACNSEKFADDLVNLNRVDLAIGTTSKIENQAARAGAVTFYSRIMAGQKVQHAFDASAAVVSIQQMSVQLVLKDPRGNADKPLLQREPGPLLVARFVDTPPVPRPRGWFAFQVGLFSCPRETHQVIFFTDDPRYAAAGLGTLEQNMSTLVRGFPDSDGEFWVEVNDHMNWYSTQEVRIYASGVMPSGKSFTVDATKLSDAVERFFIFTNGGVVPDDIRGALAKLLPPQRLVRFTGFGPSSR